MEYDYGVVRSSSSCKQITLRGSSSRHLEYTKYVLAEYIPISDSMVIDNCLAPAKPYSVTLVHICSFLPEFSPISIALKKEDSMRVQPCRISIAREPHKLGDRST
jgi:hypothetical protein